MKTVRAGQLIYTNVEAAQSPKRQAGFQTLFHSQNCVSEAECIEAASRLFYRPPAGTLEPVKHVFYRTRAGQFALAQVVPIEEPDAANRIGRYFAHALVFSPDDFASLSNNPFAVFRNFRFWTTIEEALAAGDMTSGHIAPVEIIVPDALIPTETQHLNSLSPLQRQDLLLLATQLAEGNDTRNALGLFGTPEAVFEFLEELLLHLPMPLRGGCHFDTFFTGGELHLTPYWAVGLPDEKHRSPRLFSFDLQQGQFTHRVELATGSLYGQWLDWAGSVESPSSTRAETVFELAQWLEGKASLRSTTLDHVSDEDFHRLQDLSGGALSQRFTERLHETLGSLAIHIAPFAVDWARQQGPEALRAVQNGFPHQQIIEWLYEFYLRRTDVPSPNEMHALNQIVMQYNDRFLRLMVWRWNKQWQLISEALPYLQDNDFFRFVAWAMAPVPLEVEWAIQWDKSNTNCTLGPCVRIMVDHLTPQGAVDASALLMVITGTYEEAPNGASFVDKYRQKVPFLRKSDGQSHEAEYAVSPARLAWLVNYLSKRSLS